MSLLDTITGPADVRALTPSQLPALSEEIRRRLIDCCSLTGGHIDTDSGSGVEDRDMYGIVVQGSYLFNDTIEPFARGEYLHSDEDGDDSGVFVTVGVNYYFRQHDAKFTLDVMFIVDGDAEFSNDQFGTEAFGRAQGFADGADDDTVLLRAQFQLLF